MLPPLTPAVGAHSWQPGGATLPAGLQLQAPAKPLLLGLSFTLTNSLQLPVTVSTVESLSSPSSF